MIPIKPRNALNWDEADCSWYLEELKKITISRKRCKSWEKELELKSLEQSFEAGDEASGENSGRDSGACGRTVAMEQLFTLWSQYLEKSLDSDSLNLIRQQLPEESLTDREISLAEKLILSRFSVLYQLWENLTNPSRKQNLPLLELLGSQMVTIYEEKLSKQGINKMLIFHQRVNVCPYCGIGLVATRVNNNMTAQLDHFFPKKTAPFGIFALCLFNLIPSCYSCNHIKREKWLMVSPYDEGRSASDFVFRWRPSNRDAYRNLVSNPLQVLEKQIEFDFSEKEIEIILEERQTDGPGSSRNIHNRNVNFRNEKIYHNGYGNDLVNLGLAGKKQERESGDEIIVVSYFEDIVKELLCFSYRNPHMDALGRDYERLSFDENELELYEKERQAGRFSETDYLRYPMAKLYHDISEQIYEEAKV